MNYYDYENDAACQCLLPRASELTLSANSRSHRSMHMNICIVKVRLMSADDVGELVPVDDAEEAVFVEL